jgi:hypothetical protein
MIIVTVVVVEVVLALTSLKKRIPDLQKNMKILKNILSGQKLKKKFRAARNRETAVIVIVVICSSNM